jgi:hypothetical protein
MESSKESDLAFTTIFPDIEFDKIMATPPLPAVDLT